MFEMERVVRLSEEKHELEVDVQFEYFWPDERLKSNKSMRLNYEKIQDSSFWIPKFDFVNATLIKIESDDVINLYTVQYQIKICKRLHFPECSQPF